MPCGHGDLSFSVAWAVSGEGKARVCAAGALKTIKQGLFFERRFVCPAGTATFLFLLLGPPPAKARQGYARAGALKTIKQGLFFERRFVCPAGTEAFFYLLFGPPARRAADGGLLGAAAPPRPPLHSPRTTPLGLSHISTPTD